MPPPLSVNKLLIPTSILINSPEINELPILSPLHTHLNSNKLSSLMNYFFFTLSLPPPQFSPTNKLLPPSFYPQF